MEPPDPDARRSLIRRWIRIAAFAGLAAAAAFGAVAALGMGGISLEGRSSGSLVVSPSDPVGGLPDEPYRFYQLRPDGEPVRWNPCEPIRYEVNLELAPEGAVEDVHEAVDRVAEATGIEFVYEGETTESIDDRSDGQISERGPDGVLRYEPVLVTWVTDEDLERMNLGPIGDDLLAFARPAARRGVFVSGLISMRASLANVRGFGFVGIGPVLQHEWGHIVGLDHVRSSEESLMGERIGRLDWGEGDLDGLRLVGHKQGCLDPPDPPKVPID